MFGRLKTVAILTGALLLTACASGPKFADVKSSIPPLAEDKARIYFYRPGSMGGAAVQPSILLNGEKVGNSKPGGFFHSGVSVLCDGTSRAVLTVRSSTIWPPSVR